MSNSNNDKTSNRLRWFLSSVVVGSIIIPAFIVGTIEITFRFNAEINDRSTKEATALMEVLKEGLNPPLWSFIPENAEHLIDGVALNSAVNRITVTDALGDLFVDYYRVGYTPEPDALTLTDNVVREEKIIGKIELEYSLQPARTQARLETQQVLIITTAQVLLSLTVILFIINRRVNKPLAKLKEFAHEVARKNFDANITTVHDDEFSDLADELDFMKVALKESFDHLEDRVKQRTEDLTRVNKELTETVQRLEDAKDSLVQTEKLAALGALVAGVSHELNTPIGNGRVMSSSLYETAKQLKANFENGKMTKSQFESALDEILQGANLIERNLLKAVNLVQSFKKIAVDRTSDSRRVFKINEFIHEIESTLHHIFKSKPYELVVDLEEQDAELNSFPGVLSQIISNLINNSIMHGFENQSTGTVTVSTRSQGSSIDITVSDDGIGMTDDVKKRIFEPFFTTKMGKGGSGLGMHIVHNLTTVSLGGQLNVQSEEGKGTTVTLSIPLQAPTTDKEKSEAKKAQQSPPPSSTN
ncbi:sensor histidine kinase [Reinekea sp. G2M2-21]|uniref:sensor histidine kinase n=1 Tax=Reinekea sp. G2M2-21 TaxID=2788942 RepID=UPI0018AA2338|nr:HAMP domain-containing sensor histidine kinase [Reinekea sp. G2M2-21]